MLKKLNNLYLALVLIGMFCLVAYGVIYILIDCWESGRMGLFAFSAFVAIGIVLGLVNMFNERINHEQ
jgi:uncharacterized membrane protein YvlD (DUF360 family)